MTVDRFTFAIFASISAISIFFWIDAKNFKFCLAVSCSIKLGVSIITPYEYSFFSTMP